MRFLRFRNAGVSPLAPSRSDWRRVWRRGSLPIAALGMMIAILAGGLTWAVWDGRLDRIARVGETFALRVSVDLGLTAKSIEIEGRARTPRPDVLAAIGITGQPALLGINLEEIRQRLMALTWVETAEVERRYPDRLAVKLNEYQPFALWQYQRRLYLIARNGHVIVRAEFEHFRDLPVVVGQGAPTRAAQILDIIDSAPSLAHRVRAVILVGERRWNVRLENGIDVKLPEAAPQTAWSRLAELVRNQDILGKDISIIDLRFEDRVVVRLAHPMQPGTSKNEQEAGKET